MTCQKTFPVTEIMKKYYTIAILLLVITIAGCGQKRLPPPYPQAPQPAEPVVSGKPIDSPYQDEDASQLKQGPQPMDAPDLAGAEYGFEESDPKLRPRSAGFVNDRINFYQTKLELWKQVDQQSTIASLDAEQTQIMVNCFRDLQTVLNGYQNLHSQIFQQGGDPDQLSLENIVGLQRQDIAFLGTPCTQLLETTGSDGSGLMAQKSGSFSMMEHQINELYEAGAYDQLVQVWASIPAEHKSGMNKATVLAYADALLYLDQPAQAAEAYQQVVDSMSAESNRDDDLLSMRKRLADMYAAAGNFFAAEGQYEELLREYADIGKLNDWATLQLSMLERSMKGSPELTDYSELLRGYLRFIPAKDGYGIVYQAETFLQQYPYSPVSPNVDIIKDETTAAADRWFAESLAEADRLVQNKQLEEAITLLQSLPQDKLSSENLQKLIEKLDGLVLAEAVERETFKIEKMQALQSTWNEGAAHAESGDYDAAIAVFNQLLGTEYDARAQEQIDELSLTVAKNERRRAADLFVRSMKTDDPESRKDLLVESRQVLKDILGKYPDVEVADKVRGNIDTVEKKMNELDPMLLPELEEQERQRERLQENEIDGFDIEPSGQTTPARTPAAQVLPVPPPQALQ